MATKKRVFVSFDFDNDQALKEFILQQAKNPDSPFEVVNTSLKEAAPQATWLAEAEKRIRRSALVIVMVGLTTYKAPGVLKEVALARKHSVSTVQVIGYRDSSPTPVPDAGRLYKWNWDNLKKIIDAA